MFFSIWKYKNNNKKTNRRSSTLLFFVPKVKKRRTQIIRPDGGNLDVKPSFRRLAQVFHTFFHEWSGKRPIDFSR